MHKKTKWRNKTSTPTYNSWKSMRNRVLFSSVPAHDFYKTKGIKICQRWVNNYDAFCEDMGERPFGTTLDRIDGSGDYCPQNCRWASPREQANNTTQNILIEKNGVTKTLSEWALELELTPREIARSYKRSSAYHATTFDEIFCEEYLVSYRRQARHNQCKVCKTTKTAKWLKKGRLCNTCYHRGLRWSKRTNKPIAAYHEWRGLF